MIKVIKFNRILITLCILSISLYSIAYAIDFDARDKRVDLPVLSTPNNAVSPQMSVDQNGHVYVVYSDNREGSPSIYTNTFLPDKGWLTHSIPINTNFPRAQGATAGDATSPQVCSDNAGHVYVVWVDDRAVKAGTGKRDIFFRYAKDYGSTWYPAFIDERLDSDNPAVGDSVDPRIACDENGNVYVVWRDDRNRAGFYEVYFRSLQVQFSEPTDFIVYHQTPDVRLNTGVLAGRFPVFNPVISTDKSGNVYVAWEDRRNIPEEEIYAGIYFNVSRDHGVKWGAKATRVDRVPVGGFYTTLNPAISSDSSGHVYIAWLDNAGRPQRGDEFAPDGTYDVYFNRSSDYGVTWDEDDKRIERTGVRAEAKDVAIASNNKGVICIVWTDNSGAEKKGVSTNFNIYANHSEDYGRSFPDSVDNIRLDTSRPPGVTNATTPVVQVDNLGNVFVAWIDNPSGTYDIFFNTSAEKGEKDSWLSGDYKLDYPVPRGDSINPVMAIDNLGHVYIAWQDSRSALAKDNHNIYFISGFLDIESMQIAGQRLGEACFIATAAYGSPYERHVELLREFRDRYLMTNGPGRRFVSLYYRISPTAANLIVKHSYLKPAVRAALLPVVGVATLLVYTTPLQKIALTLSIIIIIGWSFFIIRCIMKSKIKYKN